MANANNRMCYQLCTISCPSSRISLQSQHSRKLQGQKCYAVGLFVMDQEVIVKTINFVDINGVE